MSGMDVLEVVAANGELVEGPVDVPLTALHLGSSGVRTIVRDDHVDLLMQVEHQWPPILVHGMSHEVLDGRHRYKASMRLGRETIKCVFFRGDPASAFLESVRRNLQHGLPLTLQERETAATRVLRMQPEWSDRKVARLCGLAPATVRNLRACSSDQSEQLDKREGMDGRMRPVDRVELRRQTEKALCSKPTASLREIARLVGTSPTTVGSVRARMAERKRTEHGTSTGLAPASTQTTGATAAEPLTDYPMPYLLPDRLASRPVAREWLCDSALRSTAIASEFSEWFVATCIEEEWRKHIQAVPLSRVYEIADEARKRASRWSAFADGLELRARGTCP